VSEALQVLVTDAQGATARCVLGVSAISAPNSCWRIEIAEGPNTGLRGEGGDLFDALRDLRAKLDPLGCKLLCNGARRDVWPSGMARDMGHARKAYITRAGHSTTMADLVDIFEYSEPGLIGTVEDQERYRSAWIESLRS
jgi:hypothetical protein